MSDMIATAIGEALKGNWKHAIDLNRQILKENPNDIEALNRLAFALTEAGLIKEAKKVYNKVLSLNRFNQIALKNLKRLSLFKGGKIKKKTNHQATLALKQGGLFLEEVGKTKVVNLINLAEVKVISSLNSTIPVLLVPRRRGVAVTTLDHVYLGALPDDIARRLYLLMKGGNQYEAYIKSVDRNEVSVFIREILRRSKFRNQPSFLGKGGAYYTFVREEALSEEGKPDVSRLEDLEEEEELRASGESTEEEES